MNELALFAGAGGGILGGKLLGWRTVCAVEWEPYAACVLAARQNDGLLPPFPIWDDIQTFDGKPWRGIVDVVSGGFPCQDISIAGKGDGLDGERSGMWKHMARVVGEVRPSYVFVENSPMLVHRGLERVLGDLTALGYDARWTVMGAADVGAPHRRERLWLVAYASCLGYQRETDQIQAGRDAPELCGAEVADTMRLRLEGIIEAGAAQRAIDRSKYGSDTGWWRFEPNVGRVADGVAARVDRLKAIGNGQVPLCAATAWRFLTGR